MIEFYKAGFPVTGLDISKNGNTNLKNGTTYREGNLQTTVKTKKSGGCHSFIITSIN